MLQTPYPKLFNIDLYYYWNTKLGTNT